MIIRKYLVDDINEALFCIKHELGDEAYIISKKQVRQPGRKGLFTNKKVEVTVGVVNPGNANENKLSPKRIRSAICTHQGQEENYFLKQISDE